MALKYGHSVIFSYGGIVEDIITLIEPANQKKTEIFNHQVLETVKTILGNMDKAVLGNKKLMDKIKEGIDEKESFHLVGDWEIFFEINTVIC